MTKAKQTKKIAKPAWQQLHVPGALIDALWQIARRRKTQTTWQQIAREAIHEKIEKGQ